MDDLNFVYIVPQYWTGKLAETERLCLGISVVYDCLINECTDVIKKYPCWQRAVQNKRFAGTNVFAWYKTIAPDT